MNSVYSAVPEGDCLHQNTCLDSKQSGMSNGSLTLKQLFFRESGTGSLTKHPFLTISHLSSIKGTPEAIRAWLMLLPQASRVNHLASPESNSQKTIHGINGRKLGIASASYDRDTRSWKTSQVSCLNHTSDEYSGIWPKSGMMLDGKLYPLKKQAIATKEIDCGLWRTPDSSSGGEISIESLNMMANGNNKRISGHHKQLKLKDQVRHPGLFPTPTNSMMTMQDMEQARFAGNWNRPKYRDCFPTPTVNDSKNNNPPSQKNRNTPPLNSIVNGQLNPDWVEWLMGWPIGWSDLKPLTELKWLDPSIDPHPDISRTTDKKTNRVSRLKAIGNGQVPLCAAKAWEVLKWIE